jgi:hypothetical protein
MFVLALVLFNIVLAFIVILVRQHLPHPFQVFGMNRLYMYHNLKL